MFWYDQLADNWLTITPELRNLDYILSESTRTLIHVGLPVGVWRSGLELLLEIIPIKAFCLRKRSQCVGAVLQNWTVVYIPATKEGRPACRNQLDKG